METWNQGSRRFIKKGYGQGAILGPPFTLDACPISEPHKSWGTGESDTETHPQKEQGKFKSYATLSPPPEFRFQGHHVALYEILNFGSPRF